MINFITDESELHKEGYYVYYFYAPWLNQHKKMMVMLTKASNKYDLNVYSINTDNFKSICKRFNVTSIPTIIAFKDNKEINRLNGICLTSALMSFFSDILKNTGDNESRAKKDK